MTVFCIIDWVLFIILALCVGYLFVFAFASLFYKDKKYKDTSHYHNFLVLFPSYAEDSVIINSVKTFLEQDYPNEHYHVAVISDHQSEETNKKLQELPVSTLIATYTNSSKAKALTLAMDTIEGEYDTVVILDADNLAPKNFLSELNRVRDTGAQAIQVHRRGIVSASQISLLDGVSEEINTGFFRTGHRALGFSSALTGSGMAFEYIWFKDNICNASTSGEDKELEAMLLKQRIKISYLNNLYVYDKKTEKKEAIGNQRKRWMAAQFHALVTNLPNLPLALLHGNLSYADKIIQWMLPPRLVQIGLVFFITLIEVAFFKAFCTKWLIITLLQIAAMLLPIPKEYWNKNMIYSLFKLPVLMINTFLNLTKLKGVNKKFIHTKH